MIGVFFDFEATGLDIKTARPIELAYHITKLDPEQSILFSTDYIYDSDYKKLDPEVIKITNITDNQIESYGKPPKQVLSLFLENLEKYNVSCLIAHNLISYDYPLLLEELNRNNLPTKFVESLIKIDTKTDVPYPDGIDSRKLKYLACEHGILPVKQHSAMYDVATMEAIFFKYPLNEILELAKSPTITIQINTNYDSREEAKKRKFSWNSEKKKWEKVIKEIYLEKEIALAKPFQITVVTGTKFLQTPLMGIGI